jgi:hypothetical protein
MAKEKHAMLNMYDFSWVCSSLITETIKPEIKTTKVAMLKILIMQDMRLL